MSTQTALNIVAGGANAPAAGSTPATQTPAGPAGDSPIRSGKWAWILIGACMVIGAVLGATTYFRAAAGAERIGSKMREMHERGAVLTGPECVADALDWHDKGCDAPGRMCIEAVPRVVGECLAGQDRSALCIENGNNDKPSQWAYNKCKDRGIDRKSKKGIKESCTQAWRALDSWCKSGQKGVAL